MKPEVVYTKSAPKTGFSEGTESPIAQGVKCGQFLFVSGQGPYDPKTGDVRGESIQEQTRQCLTNVSAILEAAGSSLGKVVSATFIMAEEGDFAGFNEEWLKWFPKDPPARQGAKLPVRPKGIRISIAVIAEC